MGPQTPAIEQIELPDRAGNRSTRYRRPWIWRAAFILAILIIIAIVVPLAVLLPRRGAMSATPRSNVLLPLYIHPTGDAWQPLYTALNATTSLNYTVIVNPSSGPGSGSLPDSDYITAITKLNTYSNVRTVGYVPTGYASRNVNLVLADIQTYSGWASQAGLAVHGIFFDEVPHQDSADVAAYLSTIDAAVKQASGILSDRTVIHNPGTIQESGLVNNNIDITVTFEGPYSSYQTQQSALALLPLDRSHYAFVVHSTPNSTDVGSFVTGMAQHAGYLFVTNLAENYYESFGADWNSFVKAMPT